MSPDTASPTHLHQHQVVLSRQRQNRNFLHHTRNTTELLLGQHCKYLQSAHVRPGQELTLERAINSCKHMLRRGLGRAFSSLLKWVRY